MPLRELEKLGYQTYIGKWLAFPIYDNFIFYLSEYFYKILGFIKSNENQVVVDRSNAFNIAILKKIGGLYRIQINNDNNQENVYGKKIDKNNILNYIDSNTVLCFDQKVEFDYLISTVKSLLFYENRKKKLKISKKISASDIAMFSFCPASFSINLSYDIISNYKMDYGSHFHEQTRLLKIAPDEKKTKDYSAEKPKYIYDTNGYFFEELSNSKILYAGHTSEGKEKYFFNERYVGQPDYIFQNQNGIQFVVEEKFRETKNNNINNTTKLHKNYELQIASYIHGIKEYNIEYGYLVYWEYLIEPTEDYLNNIIIIKCTVFKIDKSASLKSQLNINYSTIKEIITSFEQGSTQPFDVSKLNTNKCVSCSVQSICRHKSGLLTAVDFPYYGSSSSLFDKHDLPSKLSKYKIALDLFLSNKYPCQKCQQWFDAANLFNCELKPILNPEGKLLKNKYHKFDFEVFNFYQANDMSDSVVGRPPFSLQRLSNSGNKIVLCDSCKSDKIISVLADS